MGKPLRPTIFLDACCLLNLFATGRVHEILKALPYEFGLAEPVLGEVLRLRRPTAAEGEDPFEPLSAQQVITAGSATLFRLEEAEELAQWVRFAAQLGDGEAATCALAVVHSGGVATDDRKALGLLARSEPTLLRLQTPQLLAEWADRAALSKAQVQHLVTEVRDRARFVPRRDAPHADWWLEHLQG